MKKIVTSAILVLIVASMAIGIVAAIEDPFGPAPNSGDGVSDGSGNDMQDWPNGGVNGEAPGPAPNVGDGISDGSGF